MHVDDGFVSNKDEEIEGRLQEEFKVTIGSLENFFAMQIVSK